MPGSGAFLETSPWWRWVPRAVRAELYPTDLPPWHAIATATDTWQGDQVARADTPSPTRAPSSAGGSWPTPAAPRFVRGGIDLDAGLSVGLEYPASLDTGGTERFDGLRVLMADHSGANYQRFTSEYDHQVFVHADLPSGSFVLSVHDGTLRLSGRELEAEPLRRLIEGKLRDADPLEEIEARLAALVGRELVLHQGALTARFVIAEARRMSAEDVAAYSERAAELSLYMGPLARPEASFLMLFCSGRQPGEPRRTFPGRYLLVLEESAP
jgi:hypothetical protein